MNQYVIVTGSLNLGFKLHGPFNSRRDAAMYGGFSLRINQINYE